MNLLNPDNIKSFFNEDWSIFTKIKHEAPAKYDHPQMCLIH